MPLSLLYEGRFKGSLLPDKMEKSVSEIKRPSSNLSLIGRGISKIFGRRELSSSLLYEGRFKGSLQETYYFK
jgi:hypothetical protein